MNNYPKTQVVTSTNESREDKYPVLNLEEKMINFNEFIDMMIKIRDGISEEYKDKTNIAFGYQPNISIFYYRPLNEEELEARRLAKERDDETFRRWSLKRIEDAKTLLKEQGYIISQPHEQPDDYWELVIDELGLDDGMCAVLKNGTVVKEFNNGKDARAFYLEKSGNLH